MLRPIFAVCFVCTVGGLRESAASTPQPQLQAEFALPVYLNANTVTLALRRVPPAEGDLRIEVRFAERLTRQQPRGSIVLDMPAGTRTTRLPVHIGDWPDGEYLATIQAQGAGHRFVRILRKQTILPPARPAEPIHVQGTRMLFVDDWHLDRVHGLRSDVCPAEVWPVTTGMLQPGHRKQNPTELALEPDGSVVVAITSFNPRRPERTRYVARSRDLKRWDVAERGAAKAIAPLAQRSRVTVPWRWHDVKGQKAKYRSYDPQRDGPVDLKHVHVQYSGWTPSPTRWGDLEIPGRSTFPVWRKSPGKFLVLTQRPLTADKWLMADGDTGEWADSNDNWGGQWLSPDGTTLHFCQARVIPRHEPFRIPYDNIMGSRILVVWSTGDGLSWTPTYLTTPTAEDPMGLQFYGAHGFWAEGRRLRLAYLWTYDQALQQIGLDLAYSRNGVSWRRLSGPRGFVPNGPLGSWNFGLVAPMHMQPLERDGHMYHLLQGVNAPHFYLWTAHGAPGVSAAYLRRRFGGDGALDAWPHWPAFGSWQALAQHLRHGSFTTAVMRCRRDGWIALRPEGAGGTFVTKVLVGGDRVALNARTRPNGFIRVEVLDAAGRELARYCGDNAAVFTGDSVSHDLAWGPDRRRDLPGAPLRLRVRIRSGELFALEW